MAYMKHNLGAYLVCAGLLLGGCLQPDSDRFCASAAEYRKAVSGKAGRARKPSDDLRETRKYIHIETVENPLHTYIKEEHRSGYDSVNMIAYYESLEKSGMNIPSRVALTDTEGSDFTIYTAPGTACARCHAIEKTLHKTHLEGTAI